MCASTSSCAETSPLATCLAMSIAESSQTVSSRSRRTGIGHVRTAESMSCIASSSRSSKEFSWPRFRAPEENSLFGPFFRRDEALLDCKQRRGRTCRDADLRIDALDVIVGRLRGNPEDAADLLRGTSLRNPPQNLDLAGRQIGRPLRLNPD